jgi:hypothetical protein
MEWTMPRPVVQGIAALLALGAAGSFAMGLINAPDRGRMPGERVRGAPTGPATVINAPEATPLTQERIEAAPKPVEKPVAKTDESDDSDDADTAATNTTPPTATTTAPVVTATNTTPTILPPDTNPSPPQEEPPH